MNRKIYHITPVENLKTIVAEGRLWSDFEMRRQKKNWTAVGMSEIKRRRLEEITVDCCGSVTVGRFVPFYFCPRSVMLYLLHRSNHMDLDYRGGQAPMVHLEADIESVLRWAREAGRPWAFSRTNAGAKYTAFFNDSALLAGLDWPSIDARDWRDPVVKESKQAEFLVYESFPWELVSRIGVINTAKQSEAAGIVSKAAHMPPIALQRDWYY